MTQQFILKSVLLIKNQFAKNVLEKVFCKGSNEPNPTHFSLACASDGAPVPFPLAYIALF